MSEHQANGGGGVGGGVCVCGGGGGHMYVLQSLEPTLHIKTSIYFKAAGRLLLTSAICDTGTRWLSSTGQRQTTSRQLRRVSGTT